MLLSGGNSRPLLCHCSVTNCEAQFVRGNSHNPDLRSHFRFEVKTTSHHSEFLQKDCPLCQINEIFKKNPEHWLTTVSDSNRLITGGSKLTDWTIPTSEIPTESDTRPEFLLKTVKPNQHFIISTFTATKFFKLQPFQILSDFYFTIYNIKLIRNFIEPDHHLPSWSSWPSSVCLPTYISVLVKKADLTTNTEFANFNIHSISKQHIYVHALNTLTCHVQISTEADTDRCKAAGDWSKSEQPCQCPPCCHPRHGQGWKNSLPPPMGVPQPGA